VLTLTPEQIAAIEAKLADDFVDRAAARLVEVFPEEMQRVKDAGSGKTAVPDFVRSAITRAEGLGLDRERDLMVFIVVLITNSRLQGKELGFYGWARPLFDRADTPGRMKIAMIAQRLQAMRKRNPLADRICQSLEAAVEGF
jgi:hypothetical protein